MCVCVWCWGGDVFGVAVALLLFLLLLLLLLLLLVAERTAGSAVGHALAEAAAAAATVFELETSWPGVWAIHDSWMNSANPGSLQTHSGRCAIFKCTQVFLLLLLLVSCFFEKGSGCG